MVIIIVGIYTQYSIIKLGVFIIENKWWTLPQRRCCIHPSIRRYHVERRSAQPKCQKAKYTHDVSGMSLSNK